MTRPQTVPADRNRIVSYLRPLAIVAAWISSVGLATWAFFAPRGVEFQPNENDVVAFALSLAVASAVAVSVSLAVAGRWRRALEVAVSTSVAGLLLAALVAYLFEVDMSFVRSRVDLWTFQQYQRTARNWAVQFPGFLVPLGAIVGLALGLVTGLLCRLSQRQPRLAHSIGLCLLFAIASEPGRWIASGIVTRLGWMIRYRLVPWSVADDQIAVTGTLLGAITGAVFARLALHVTRSRTSQEPSGAEPQSA